MGVRKTSVAVDSDLLERAGQVLGTSTVRETIHLALLELVRRRARREEVAALAAMEGMDLADPTTMSGAWRQ